VIADDERGERNKTAVFSELRSGAPEFGGEPEDDDEFVLEMPG
jgi:hypothetical protein